jgi:flagellin
MSISSISSAQQLAMERISTAQVINRASDDAAGLAISEEMRGQVRGDQAATRNMRDSQSMLDTAEGALNASGSVLQRMRELSVQANNGVLTDSDRSIIQEEFSQLRDSLNSVAGYTQFNTKNLLDGSFNNQKTTTNVNGETIPISIDSAFTDQLGDSSSGKTIDSINLVSNPSEALKIIDGAISQISGSRASIGATQNRLDYAVNVSETEQSNLQAAESRIRDSDIAKQAIELNRTNLLQQTYFATQKIKQNMAGQVLDLLA